MPKHGNACGCAVCIPSVKKRCEENSERATRDCLRCGKPFESSGIGNRLCRACRVNIDRHVPTWTAWGE